ncbi:hypothetical protein A5703_07395 [Mycobacterium sp. E188]|nr:hypothetical protein A5703_07395 [Mycobacterium sp. E188]
MEAHDSPQRLLVSVQEALYQLSISRSRLYDLVGAGDLTAAPSRSAKAGSSPGHHASLLGGEA